MRKKGKKCRVRESINGKAKAYIGASGMSTLTYDQTLKRLRERYAVPWMKTQQASLKFFTLRPPHR